MVREKLQSESGTWCDRKTIQDEWDVCKIRQMGGGVWCKRGVASKDGA